MGSVASVLRVLIDFGEAAGWLIAAFVVFACGRRILRENEAAHAAIRRAGNRKTKIRRPRECTSGSSR